MIFGRRSNQPVALANREVVLSRMTLYFFTIDGATNPDNSPPDISIQTNLIIQDHDALPIQVYYEAEDRFYGHRMMAAEQLASDTPHNNSKALPFGELRSYPFENIGRAVTVAYHEHPVIRDMEHGHTGAIVIASLTSMKQLFSRSSKDLLGRVYPVSAAQERNASGNIRLRLERLSSLG